MLRSPIFQRPTTSRPLRSSHNSSKMLKLLKANITDTMNSSSALQRLSDLLDKANERYEYRKHDVNYHDIWEKEVQSKVNEDEFRNVVDVGIFDGLGDDGKIINETRMRSYVNKYSKVFQAKTIMLDCH